MMKITFTAMVVSASAITGATAESEGAITVTLDKMTRADEVAIQRGYSDADSRCFYEVLDKLEGSRVPKRDIYITFEDPDFPGISVTFADTDDNYACANGEMRSYEMGEYMVLKRFAD